jgi:hypothetical protein
MMSKQCEMEMHGWVMRRGFQISSSDAVTKTSGPTLSCGQAQTKSPLNIGIRSANRVPGNLFFQRVSFRFSEAHPRTPTVLVDELDTCGFQGSAKG